MRIVGGELKGRRLLAPKGNRVRPTSEKAREALFAILGDSLIGRDFVDLFAGTGAVGIEALSRGARRAAFVEAHVDSLKLIGRNLQSAGVEDRAVVMRATLPASLGRLAAAGLDAGVVFIDPPYEFDAHGKVLSLLAKAGIVGENTAIIVEHAAKKPLEIEGAGIVETDARRYGDTGLSFFRLTPTL